MAFVLVIRTAEPRFAESDGEPPLKSTATVGYWKWRSGSAGLQARVQALVLIRSSRLQPTTLLLSRTFSAASLTHRLDGFTGAEIQGRVSAGKRLAGVLQLNAVHPNEKARRSALGKMRVDQP